MIPDEITILDSYTWVRGYKVHVNAAAAAATPHSHIVNELAAPNEWG